MMETVRVNMTPNNEIKTIHCSQNDGKTRKWGFELYKEDGVIDGSSIGQQMIFDSFVGGTEEILSDNGTSPIIADIQYPDAMRSDQEFLYRESPATENGQAEITKIKGNTIIENGSLLSFNGTSIKTVGKNLFDKSTPISRGQYSVGTWVNQNSRITTDYIRILPNIDYTMFVDLDRSADLSFANYNYFDGNKVWLGDRSVNGDTSLGGLREKTFNIHNDSAMYIRITFWKDTDREASIATQTLQDAYFQLQLGSVATSYTNYVDSVYPLLVSKYFSTGMKSIGNIYDELSYNKATKRLGLIVIDGSVNPTTAKYTEGRCFYDVADISTWSETSVIDTTVLSNYLPQSSNALTVGGNQGIHRRSNGSHQICVGLGVALGLNDLTAWNAYLAEHPLTVYYELDSYVETDIITASLVTEKGETPLYYDDGLIADCNETISSESGIFDAKIKVVDSETVYSQKLQLHVERKP